VATLAAIWNTLEAWPWPMIAAILSLIAVSILIWVNFIRPARRSNKLRAPVDAVFIIHKKQHRYSCQFAKQDEDDHESRTIVLPSKSKIIIDLVFKPRIYFRSTEYYLGCDGDDVNKKPIITQYLNRFIEIGEGKEIVPGPGNKHMIDVYGYYHKRDQ
jgi:hypothetical protein